MQLYNTLTREKEIFIPLNKDKVKVFVCGPTVYNRSHLGHGRSYTVFDIIVKYLRYKGYNVFYLQNITDIDDKIIQKAHEENTSPQEIAKKYTQEYFKDMESLGVTAVDTY